MFVVIYIANITCWNKDRIQIPTQIIIMLGFRSVCVRQCGCLHSKIISEIFYISNI